MTTLSPDRSRQESYRSTLARLAAAQKTPAPGSPAYSIYVNRRVGRFIAAWAYRAGLTPNAVTAISALFTFSGILILAIAEPAWWSGVTVWALLAVGYAFDSADGQVARLRGGGSLAGEWLDHVVDCLKISTLHLAVLVTAYLHFGLDNPTWLLVPIGYAIVNAVAFFTMILNDQLKKSRPRPADAPAPRRSVVRSILVIPTDYGLLCILFLLLGAVPFFMIGYTLLFAANLLFLLLASVKWFGDLRALDADRGSS